MAQSLNHNLKRFEPDHNGVMFGTTVELTIPADFEFLGLLCELVREYCATLPLIFKQQPVRQPHHEIRARRFGTGKLTLEDGQTIESSYSHFVYSVQLILQEACTNVIRYGYAEKPQNLLHLDLSTAMLRDVQGQFREALILVLSDTAPAFDPTSVVVRQPDPLELREGGYGLYLINKLTDKLEYSYRNGRNQLKMTKYIGEPE